MCEYTKTYVQKFVIPLSTIDKERKEWGKKQEAERRPLNKLAHYAMEGPLSDKDNK